MSERKNYDVIVIGAGPGGLTAALYAARANLKVVILDRGIYGGQMNNTAGIDNYPGFVDIQGPELGEKMYQTAMNAGAEFAYGDVQKIEQDGNQKIIKTDSGEYEAAAVVIATGAVHKHLGVAGEEEYAGKGVSYCAVCDGPFFKGDEVAVVGGGNSALEEAIYLTKFAKKVHLIVRRDVFRADKIIQDHVQANDKIEIHFLKKPHHLIAKDNKVAAIALEDSKTGEVSELAVKGVFPFVGLDPITDFVKDLGITDERGYIITNELMETSVKGIYAAGDVRQKVLRQVVTATNDGAIVGQQVGQGLNN